MKLVIIASLCAVAALSGCASDGGGTTAFRGDPPEGFTRAQYAKYLQDSDASPGLTPEQWLLTQKLKGKNKRETTGGGFGSGLKT